MGTRSPSTSTVDGTFRAFLTANQPRQDLVDAGLTNFPDAPVGTITWKGVKHRYLGEGHNLNSWQAIEQADGSWVVQTTPTLTQGTTTFDDGVWLYDVVNGGTRVRGWYSAEEYRDHVRVCSIAAGVPQSLQPTSAPRTTARCSGMRTRKSREKFHGAMLGYAATSASAPASRRAN